MAGGGFSNMIGSVADAAHNAVRSAQPQQQPQGTTPAAATDAFKQSQAYQDFVKSQEGAMHTMDMYDSPYFGLQGSGSYGRALDKAYENSLKQPQQQPQQQQYPPQVLPQQPRYGYTGGDGRQQQMMQQQMMQQQMEQQRMMQQRMMQQQMMGGYGRRQPMGFGGMGGYGRQQMMPQQMYGMQQQYQPQQQQYQPQQQQGLRPSSIMGNQTGGLGALAAAPMFAMFKKGGKV